MKTDSTAIQRLVEVSLLFLKMGFIAFGGPVAHIAMYRQEVVTRRHWLTDQEFLDLLGVTNLIPGPNSTEMVIHIGLRRAGWAGFFLAGLCFIVPAMSIVLVIAWLYSRFGTTPQAGWLVTGIKPVIITIILHAFWGMGRTAIKDRLAVIVGIASVVFYFLGMHPIYVLLICGSVVMLIQNASRLRTFRIPAAIALSSGIAVPALLAAPFSLGLLFLTFLKIGAVLYGSGYVLLAFLHADFVERLGWLTEGQLLDAIAVGQVTPGPLFTSATFIGYLLAGVPGALLSTLGIFLPSFLFVALSSSLIPYLRNSPWLSSFLDGVIVASLGLMAGVTWQLAASSLTTPISLIVALISGALLVLFKVNTTWLIFAGALAGYIFRLG